ncbi:MAG: ATPase domain-containing protein [Candidatus Bathyarchaeia archaeon]
MKMKVEIQRTPTGIDGLDAMLSGGFPKGRTVLICGGPGTGKTTLSMQFLFYGYVKYKENGVFVSLDEPKERIFQEARCYGWDLRGLHEKGKIAFVEASPHTSKKFSIEKLIQEIEEATRSVDAQRISLDPLTYLTLQYPDIISRRSAILALFKALIETEATCLITDEIRGGGEERTILVEEYLADGVIILQSSQVERRRVRTIEIEKMRGTPIDDQIRPYILDENGIKVISEKDIFTYAASLLMKK